MSFYNSIDYVYLIINLKCYIVDKDLIKHMVHRKNILIKNISVSQLVSSDSRSEDSSKIQNIDENYFFQNDLKQILFIFDEREYNKIIGTTLYFQSNTDKDIIFSVRVENNKIDVAYLRCKMSKYSLTPNKMMLSCTRLYNYDCSIDKDKITIDSFLENKITAIDMKKLCGHLYDKICDIFIETEALDFFDTSDFEIHKFFEINSNMIAFTTCAYVMIIDIEKQILLYFNEYANIDNTRILGVYPINNHQYIIFKHRESLHEEAVDVIEDLLEEKQSSGLCYEIICRTREIKDYPDVIFFFN